MYNLQQFAMKKTPPVLLNSVPKAELLENLRLSARVRFFDLATKKP